MIEIGKGKTNKNPVQNEKGNGKKGTTIRYEVKKKDTRFRIVMWYCGS
ncbi:hypothetical protein [Thermicanus aegyptius]|nr:hypothetical protein [Thermicanus aegyptius]